MNAVKELLEDHSSDDATSNCLDEATALVSSWEVEDLSIVLVYQELQRLCYPRILVDKTPVYCSNLNVLQRARHQFPRACWIHMTRHPIPNVIS